MRPRCFARLLIASVFASFVSRAAVGQTQTAATIRGRVTDPSGLVLVGSTVSAQPLDSAAPAIRTRNGAEGEFSLTLAPGRYRVSAEHRDFAQAQQEFTVASGDARTWNVQLELEPMAASVVVTDTARPTPAETAPDLVDVITKDQIDQRGEIWLTDMLAAQQGAGFSRLGPLGGITSFFLDGGNSNYTKVLVDGSAVNQPGGAIDFSNFMLENIDKIEIVHGASSALYGTDAMDGVIQAFTHRGTSRTPELALEGDGGTFRTGHGSAQLSGLLGAFDYSAGGSYFATDGQGPDDFFHDATGSGNFGWKLSDSDSVRLAIRNSASDAGQPGQTLLGAAFTDLSQSSALHDFSSNLNWSLQTGPHWRHQLTGYESRFQDFGVFAPGPGGSFVDKFNRAGFDGRSTYLFYRGALTAGYMNEVETGNQHHRNNQAGYGELRYQFSPRMTATVGARAEDNASFGTRVVPRLGAVYHLRQGNGFWGYTHLRASYGLGIKEPDFTQSFSTDPCFPGSPRLKPERSVTFSSGVEQALVSDRIRLTVTYFHNDFYDIVSFAGAPPMPNCPFGTGTYFNTDQARAFGADSSFEIKATRWLNIAGNYTYDNSKVLKSPNATDPALVPGNRLLKRPLDSANLALNARWREASWNLAGRYIGRRADSDFDGLGITSDPGYFRLDMAVTVPLRYGLSTTAHFENLLDRHYQDAVGYPALGYNYRLGLRYVWGGER